MSNERYIEGTSSSTTPEQTTTRTKRIRELINEPAPVRQTMSVGQAPIVPDQLAPEVAVIRYISVIVAMFVFSIVAGLKLGWSLSFVLLIFSIASLAAVGVLTLIETKQLQGVVNSILDYRLNLRQIDNDADVRQSVIDNAMLLDFYQVRHRQLLERQQFLIDNRLKLLGDGNKASDIVLKDLAPSLEAGAFIDTIAEDQIADSLMAYFVSLFDAGPSGSWDKLKGDGEIIVEVPWAENGPMSDEDRDIALTIFRTIASRRAPIVTEKDGKWYLNIKSYDRPISVVMAFDTVYQDV